MKKGRELPTFSETSFVVSKIDSDVQALKQHHTH